MRIVLYESYNHNPVVDINTEIKALGSVEIASKSFINKTQTAIFLAYKHYSVKVDNCVLYLVL